MKKAIVLLTVFIETVFSIGYFPLPPLPVPSACKFNGPQDAATLRGQNFIGNLVTETCMNLRNTGPANRPVTLSSCSWSSFPKSDQLYLFRNGNGGTILKPTVNSFGSDACLTASYTGQLSTAQCIPKSSEQTWKFQRIRNGPLQENLYQIIQSSTGRCAKASSKSQGATIQLTRCNSQDDYQLWRICTSK